MACAVFTVLGTLPYVLLHRDRVLPAGGPPGAVTWRAFLAGFWISPRRHPDFGWAWLTRFLINLGNALALLYLLYYLRDVLHRPDPERRRADPDGGQRRDAAGHGRRRRASGRTGSGGGKPFVLWSGVIMAVADRAAGRLADLAGRALSPRRCSASASASSPPSTSR